MGPSFFEGPEKKVELVVVPQRPSLRTYGRPFWDSVVEAAGARILASQSNKHFDAHLLSESSLFIYDDFLTMITCGQTRLVDAVAVMLERIGKPHVGSLIYERKNEHFPHEQPSGFLDDARQLASWLDGRALKFGTAHEHTVDVFHTTRPSAPHPEDTTLEILMHGINREVMERFRGVSEEAQGLMANRVGLSSIAPDFELQEHLFRPSGYSVNGMRGKDYLTVHVTPERVGSYVSFETNMDFRSNPSRLVQQVVDLFQPESFDVVVFVPDADALTVDVDGFRLRKHVQEPMVGYQVTFQHFFRECRAPQRATQLDLGTAERPDGGP